MRYKVIQIVDDVARIVCNVAERYRALNICDAYRNSYVVDSNGECIYSNVTIEYTYGRRK